MYFTISFTSVPALASVGSQVALPFLSPSVPLEVLIKNQVDSKTKTIFLTTPLIKAKVDKVKLTSQQMDQLYQLAIKYRNNSLSTEDLITELRGGAIQDWVAVFGVIIAIITVLNNIDAFQIPIVHPNGAVVGPADNGIQGHLHYPKVGGRIKVRMSNSNQNQCPSDATQVSNFYTNNRLDLQKAFEEVQRRASEIGCDNFECSFERFKALVKEGTKVTETGIREAIGALQGEMLGYYKDTIRGNYGKGVFGPDFKVVVVILLIWKSKILLVRRLRKLVEG